MILIWKFSPKSCASIQCSFCGHIFNTLLIFSEIVTTSDSYCRGYVNFGNFLLYLRILLQCTGSILTHSYNTLMVAQVCRGCWCRLTTAFAFHINCTQIAIYTSTCYFLTNEAQASLCKCADSLELIALSSGYVCANVQTHQSIRCWCE